MAREEVDTRLKELRELVEEEIRRRLVADRGVEAMARTLRKPLPEDIEFMHASRDEMLALQHAVYPLTRALAARLAQRRRRRNRGHLDFRKTVRASLSYGGVPAEPKFRNPHPSKPEVMVVADISGSVASFARFTLMFVYAMASQFSKVRSWVFIDGIDEVTRFFHESDDVLEAVHRVNTEADVVWVDGHSDYGHAFEVFHQRHYSEITPKTSIILLGDARNNYHASQTWVVDELRKRGRHVYWLDPEPRSYWDTGDSIVSEYGRFCDGVFECRNLRQLQKFVETVAEALTRGASERTGVNRTRYTRSADASLMVSESCLEHRPGAIGDAGEREELGALAAAERMAVASDEESGLVATGVTRPRGRRVRWCHPRRAATPRCRCRALRARRGRGWARHSTRGRRRS